MSELAPGKSSNEVLILGNELLMMLQEDLFSRLQSELELRWGSNWLAECSIFEKGNHGEPKSDLQFLLKQIIQMNNGNFRLAISKQLFGELKMTKEQLDSLSKIQVFRNSWAHPIAEQMTLSLLRELSLEILRLYGNKKNSLVEYCFFIKNVKGNDFEALPRILANSVLFRKHVGIIDNLVADIAENSNLLAQITQLKDRIKMSPNHNYAGSGVVPGYENLTFDELRNTIDTLLHTSITAIRSFANLNAHVALESMKSVTTIKKYSKNKEILDLIKKFESQEMSELSEILTGLMEFESELVIDEVIPPECTCSFCEFGTQLGMFSVIRKTTELTTEIWEIAKNQKN